MWENYSTRRGEVRPRDNLVEDYFWEKNRTAVEARKEDGEGMNFTGFGSGADPVKYLVRWSDEQAPRCGSEHDGLCQ